MKERLERRNSNFAKRRTVKNTQRNLIKISIAKKLRQRGREGERGSKSVREGKIGGVKFCLKFFVLVRGEADEDEVNAVSLLLCKRLEKNETLFKIFFFCKKQSFCEPDTEF